MTGKPAAVRRHRDVGRGPGTSRRTATARGAATEAGPLCAGPAAFGASAATPPPDATPGTGVVITAAGNRAVSRLGQMRG
ncbi:hypothetical protein LNKW23_07090 [Paralimibaculum aggregatum]|uniref:Uncharacterized protein n=2 Tax=Paralimibaculum aggregatum TaxID=3036245 RepID=A0ABQ6LDS3_9RHOB|nr:hypothetical protein LNKW23_07090 [Limibaculum sp. NKW23]